MDLYLIRHLPTQWNLEGKLQGKRDIPIDFQLANHYKEKIARNKKVLATFEPFNKVLASSLIRTRQTANLYGFEPDIEPLLDELDFGVYEGKAKVLLINDHNEQWFLKPESLELGETIKALQERIVLFLGKFQNDEKVLVFGHGSWIRALISIHKSGNVNLMNQFKLTNNELIHINISSLYLSRS